jgi:hypothetical protein
MPEISSTGNVLHDHVRLAMDGSGDTNGLITLYPVNGIIDDLSGLF